MFALRVFALLAVCAVALSESTYDAAAELSELRNMMDKRIEILEAKLLNSALR